MPTDKEIECHILTQEGLKPVYRDEIKTEYYMGGEVLGPIITRARELINDK